VRRLGNIFGFFEEISQVKWIPELRDLEPKEIHMFEKKIDSVGSKSLFDETVNGYPLPIVNNKTTAVEVKGCYKRF
jgi:deoxyribodipyrimidine photolyase